MSNFWVTDLVTFTRYMTSIIYREYGYSEKVARNEADDITFGFLNEFFWHPDYINDIDQGVFRERAVGDIITRILARVFFKTGECTLQHGQLVWPFALHDIKDPNCPWLGGRDSIVELCDSFAVDYCDFVCDIYGIENLDKLKFKVNIMRCSRSICSGAVSPRLKNLTRTMGQKIKVLKETIDCQAVRYMKMREEQEAQKKREAGK